ncbi:hypothetical protein [Azospirillum rugosum]|uniref:Glycosyl transferase family 8 n=1 Tax=Azospirillum rugosum TaxID=416170 RepID=A0ABS4SI50_9PROT|nr:hypothetical protein [Azospirillum rugosum]MBP2292145.1 hypothetical protein [Azospirillum rugosum]MDQ0525719.1 hypothetical protein [Azospirillum rugosum]
MTTLCVTGCDAQYFITTLALLEGMRDRFPSAPIRVCDFGMTDGQREFLRAAGMLLDRPKILQPGAHPYLCKGHLSDYCAWEPWDNLLWLDSDLMLGALDLPAVTAMADGLRRAGKSLAATATIDRLSIGGMLEELRAKGYYVEPAEAILRGRGVDPDLPYISTGLMLWVSRGPLALWSTACRSVPQHALWEQNVLNMVMMKDPESVDVLDARLWQVYDAPLADVQTTDPQDPRGLLLDGRPVMSVHASSRQGHHLDADVAFNFGDHVLKGYLRTFANPTLQQRHLRLLAAAVFRDQPALADIGVLQPR